MEMKKISLAIIVVAALLSVVLAADKPKDPVAAAATPKASATAPVGSAATTTSTASSPDSAHAPAPSGATSTMPLVGSLAGAFLVSFFGYYLQ
ncbi:hypothetical protein ACFX13_014540 [Malus domestica]